MAKYGRKAQRKVGEAMRKRKRGQLKSGSGRKVKSREQAIAIGLSEARKEGGKVPPPKKSARKKAASKKKAPARKRTAKRKSSRKTARKK